MHTFPFKSETLKKTIAGGLAVMTVAATTIASTDTAQARGFGQLGYGSFDQLGYTGFGNRRFDGYAYGVPLAVVYGLGYGAPCGYGYGFGYRDCGYSYGRHGYSRPYGY